MTLAMYDSITPANLPEGAGAYAGYVGGRWPDFKAELARFPHAHVLSIAVNPDEDADCLDVENGDATPASVPRWVRRQHARGEPRPVVYASVSAMPQVIAQLNAISIARASVRLWSAHYGWSSALHPAGKHICGPHTCRWEGVPACDGTQWRNDAPGQHGTTVDESLLEDSFFTPPVPVHPPVKVLDAYLVTPGAAGGFAGRAVQSHDGGKSWS